MERKSITLIGMPAAGKSTTGVILAKILGYDFLDTDLVLQSVSGRRLPELIEQYGPDGFIRFEERTICGIRLSHGRPAVIATGGSAVYGEKAMRHLAAFGPIAYLQVEYETLESRLRDIRQRGVVLKPGQTLRMLYDERCALYKRYAGFTVTENDSGIEAVVSRLVTYMGTGGDWADG